MCDYGAGAGANRAIPSPHLSPAINANLASLEDMKGVFLDQLPSDALGVHVRTRNSVYTLRHFEDGWKIKGGVVGARYVPVQVAGSTFGGSMLRIKWLGVGMHMEFNVEGRRTLTTSQILDVEVIRKVACQTEQAGRLKYEPAGDYFNCKEGNVREPCTYCSG